jgi:hypothetical protein
LEGLSPTHPAIFCVKWRRTPATHCCLTFTALQDCDFSVGRTCIGTSDYSTKMYSYDDSPEPDPELKHFSIAAQLPFQTAKTPAFQVLEHTAAQKAIGRHAQAADTGRLGIAVHQALANEFDQPRDPPTVCRPGRANRP